MLLKDYIGKALLNERTKQARTLRDVSEQSLVALGYLSEIERGRKEVSSGILNHICNSLNITLPDLMIEIAVAMQKDVDTERELTVELDSINHKEPVGV
jgi:transcriptional regulator with XRE-family HTH domain